MAAGLIDQQGGVLVHSDVKLIIGENDANFPHCFALVCQRC